MQAPVDAAISTSPGQRIRTARERVPLSREKLAQQAQVSTSTIVRLERDDQLPNTRALVRIATCVGVHPGDLLPQPESAAAS